MKTYGIDANVLTREKRTGTERYVFELLSEMKKMPLKEDERVVLYASAPIPEMEPLPDGWSVKILDWKLPMKGWTHIRLSLELLLRTPNVFFSPAHEIPLYSGNKKIVSTVHDVAFRRLEGIYPQQGKRRQEWAIRRAINKAHKLITVSEATKKDLAELYGVEDNHMAVVPLAVRSELFHASPKTVLQTLERHGLQPYGYFISIGRVEKKKNPITIIEAFDAFKKRTGSTACLVFGGSLGFGNEEIEARIAASPFKQDIKLLGFIEDSEMIPLMRGALAYVFPSHYEGFGIPALEAMASEIPLIASSTPALQEVAEDAALFADPDSPNEWADLMEQITQYQELRDRLVEKGRSRVKVFSWQASAEKTWDVLRNV